MPSEPGYIPHTWQCNEAITTDSLNNMEIGIKKALSSVPLIVHYSQDTGRTDRTWNEVFDAYGAGAPIYLEWTVHENGHDFYYRQTFASIATYEEVSSNVYKPTVKFLEQTSTTGLVLDVLTLVPENDSLDGILYIYNSIT